MGIRPLRLKSGKVNGNSGWVVPVVSDFSVVEVCGLVEIGFVAFSVVDGTEVLAVEEAFFVVATVVAGSVVAFDEVLLVAVLTSVSVIGILESVQPDKVKIISAQNIYKTLFFI